MDFFKAAELRHSYRGAYTNEIVPDEDLVKILDAGIRAPSGCNAQTTSFVLVTNPELKAEIAKIFGPEPVKTASALIIVVTEKITFDFGLDFELEDYGAAVENILLAITSLGYASCWYGGGVRLGGVHEKLAGLLNLPKGKEAQCILPVGVPNEQKSQPGRKSFAERVDWRR
ncbi:MAG: nitroreductase family protein [Oscillospiraceae bacterium]|nr:nitroreductase family protein [Oscillospiraceae bacterium]